MGGWVDGVVATDCLAKKKTVPKTCASDQPVFVVCCFFFVFLCDFVSVVLGCVVLLLTWSPSSSPVFPPVFPSSPFRCALCRRQRQQRATRVVAFSSAPHGRVVDHRRRRTARQIDGHQTNHDSTQRKCEEKNQDCVAGGGGRSIGLENVRHQ